MEEADSDVSTRFKLVLEVASSGGLVPRLPPCEELRRINHFK